MKYILPNILATVGKTLCFDVLLVLTSDGWYGTKLETTELLCCRNLSRTDRHDVIL